MEMYTWMEHVWCLQGLSNAEDYFTHDSVMELHVQSEKSLWMQINILNEGWRSVLAAYVHGRGFVAKNLKHAYTPKPPCLYGMLIERVKQTKKN